MAQEQAKHPFEKTTYNAQGQQAGATQAKPPAPTAAPTAAALPKKETVKREVEIVDMTDKRKVEFVGKRKLLKETIIEGNTVKVRMDFRNGETRLFTIPTALMLKSAGHGMEQKLGDETAGTEAVDDMVIAVDDLIAQLAKGEWTTVREGGGGFAGASVVIKAIMEVSGKSLEDVKAFLAKKLEATAGLTRQALYASFRSPTSKTGKVVERLEREKLAKGAKIDADEALAELG